MHKEYFDKDFRFGLLGGGQLGRMLIQEAINYNVPIHVLDPSADAPCAPIAHSFTQGDFNDYRTVLGFGADKDVLTIEIEHVNTEALKELEAKGKKVFPQPHIIELIQDKGLQKQFYEKHNIPTAPFELVDSKPDPSQLPIVQKLRKGGYDGKGVQVLRSEQDLTTAFEGPCVLESLIDFEKELSVIVARNESGEVKSYPVVELAFNPKANLVEFLFSPATISPSVEEKAQQIAKQVAEKLQIVGLLAVELFLTKNGEVLVNEIAPRTHNSGHQTIEGNVTSQFEQHLRSVLNMPLGNTDRVLSSVMVNLLGEEGHTGAATYIGIKELLQEKGVHIHLYGKTETKPFRKMGHVTIVDDSLAKAKQKAFLVKEQLKVVSK